MTLAIGLLFAGLFFLIAEIFFTSFGLFGLLSAGSLIAGVAFAFEQGSSEGVVLLVVTLVVAPLVLVGAIKVFPKTPFGKRLILEAPDGEDGRGSAAGQTRDGALRPGDRGTSLSALRPSGIAEFAGRRIDVVTEGEMIPKGLSIRVTGTSGNRIIVAADENDGLQAPRPAPRPRPE